VTQSDQPGLRLRLAHEARRIASQHSYLDALEATTLRAFERGDLAEMQQVLHGFRASLDAHFALEEQVHFPALHGLRPAFQPELDELIREHVRFREELERIDASLRAISSEGAAAEILAAFGDVTARLRRHEEREEQLLARAGETP
jgi:iron-sulfur cluster repair protein YtfE (RIC family)